MRNAVLLLTLLPSSLAAQKVVAVPLEVQIPKPPTVVAAEGRLWLNYELHLTNMWPRDLGIRSISVVDEVTGRPFETLDPAALGKRIRRPAAPEDSATLPLVSAGRRTIVFMWVAIDSGTPPPAGIRHRIVVARADSVDTAEPDTLVTFSVPVGRTAPVLASPLSGGPWVAANGPGNTSGHRRTFIPLEGRVRIAQRFATDWIKLGPDGRAWHGDSTMNANWYGYGETLRAVGDGRVTEVVDGIPENVPLAPDRAVPITLVTVGGNHVIIDLGGGQFAFYAHMIPGSPRVKVGDQVKRGQVVGRLGNSGNSDAPHLHFHLGDANSPLGSEGIPWMFERFQLLDHLPSLEAVLGSWKAKGAGITRLRELPLENSVVSFP